MTAMDDIQHYDSFNRAPVGQHKCTRCHKPLKGGAAGDCVRSKGGGYEHRGDCSDWNTKAVAKKTSPRPAAPRIIAPKPPKKSSAQRRDRKNAQRRASRAAQKSTIALPLRVCAHRGCTEHFVPKTVNQLFHSERCRALESKAAYRDRRRAELAERVCASVTCDRVFKPRTVLQRYCQLRCQWAQKKRDRLGRVVHREKVCVADDCNAVFRPNDPRQVYHSEQCSARAANQRKKARDLAQTTHLCEHCHEKPALKKYCSRACTAAAKTAARLERQARREAQQTSRDDAGVGQHGDALPRSGEDEGAVDNDVPQRKLGLPTVADRQLTLGQFWALDAKHDRPAGG